MSFYGILELRSKDSFAVISVLTYSLQSTVTISTDSSATLASADCSKSCSNGGTVTVALQCKIKGSGNDDKDCNEANFNATKCDYVVLRDKHYVCDEVKKNYTEIVVGVDTVVKNCNTVCPLDSASQGECEELREIDLLLQTLGSLRNYCGYGNEYATKNRV